MSAEVSFVIYGRSEISHLDDLVKRAFAALNPCEVVYFALWDDKNADPNDADALYSDFSSPSQESVRECLEADFDFISICVDAKLISKVDQYFLRNMGGNSKGGFTLDK